MQVKEYGYEYDAILNEELYSQTKNKVTFEKFKDAYCLRSGRDCLKTIAREYSNALVLIPALACDSMILPFKMYGHHIAYYRLNEKLKVDYLYLKFILKNNKYDTVLLLYMDYFGIESFSTSELRDIKINCKNAVFINDVTHSLLSDKNCDFVPDYVIASLRKWVNVPDGGLLWTKNTLNNDDFGEDCSFFETRLRAQFLRHQYFNCGDESIKKEYRNIFSTVSSILDSDKKPSRMSLYTFELLKSINLNDVISKRRENANVLRAIFSNSKSIKMINDDMENSCLYVPVLVSNRTAKQNTLNKKGIYNTIIWPLNEEQKQICDISKYIEEHMLAVPCDQRYTTEDMILIGNEIVRVFDE